MKTVKDLAGEIHQKRTEVNEIFEKHRTETGLKMDQAVIDDLTSRNTELESLAKEYNQARDLERMEKETAEHMKAWNAEANGLPNNAGAHEGQAKSLGELITESTAYKSFLAEGRIGMKAAEIQGVNVKSMLGEVRMKTVMTSGSYMTPEVTRSGVIVPALLPDPVVEDLIPQTNTTQNATKFLREVFNNNAETRAEGAALAESDISWTEDTAAVYSVGHILRLTDEQFEDVEQVQGLINQRGPAGLLVKREKKILSGSGTSDIRGILNTVGIQTQAKGTDPTPDAFLKAMTKVRCSGTDAWGSSTPTGLVIHFNDWQDLLLTREEGTGLYIFGNPGGPQLRTLWGLTPTVTGQIAENTAIVADFGLIQILNRKGITAEIGYVNDDFQKMQKGIRFVCRFGLVVYRPAAVCTVTGV